MVQQRTTGGTAGAPLRVPGGVSECTQRPDTAWFPRMAAGGFRGLLFCALPHEESGHDRSPWSEEAVSGRHAVPGIDHGCRVGFCIGHLA